ncbi:MAG: hypothetical protein PHI96_08180 [Desulfovibrio sp.]|nr:hypothetical protein [Desulfovibrio sp.]
MSERLRRIIFVMLLILLAAVLVAVIVQTVRLGSANSRADSLARDVADEKLRADGLEGQLRQARTSIGALGQFGADTQGNCADAFEKFLAIPGLAALPTALLEGQEPASGVVAEHPGDGAAMRTSLSRKGAADGAAPASSTPDDAAFTEFLNAF